MFISLVNLDSFCFAGIFLNSSLSVLTFNNFDFFLIFGKLDQRDAYKRWHQSTFWKQFGYMMCIFIVHIGLVKNICFTHCNLTWYNSSSSDWQSGQHYWWVMIWCWWTSMASDTPSPNGILAGCWELDGSSSWHLKSSIISTTKYTHPLWTADWRHRTKIPFWSG